MARVSSVLLPHLFRAYSGQERLAACIHCSKHSVWNTWSQGVLVTSAPVSKLLTKYSFRQITQEGSAYAFISMLNRTAFSLISLGEAGVIAEVSALPRRLLRAAQMHQTTMLHTTNIILSSTYTDVSTSTIISTV
jgi:hypothetical protein